MFLVHSYVVTQVTCLSSLRIIQSDASSSLSIPQMERKTLSASLKQTMSESEREALFQTWDIPAGSKERKLQLVQKLWTPAALSADGGLERSAELVAALCGTDATAQFLQLLFGNMEGEQGPNRDIAQGGDGSCDLGALPSSAVVGF